MVTSMLFHFFGYVQEKVDCNVHPLSSRYGVYLDKHKGLVVIIVLFIYLL